MANVCRLLLWVLCLVAALDVLSATPRVRGGNARRGGRRRGIGRRNRRLERPGVKARITQKGFDFASDLAIDLLMLELEHLRIPDVRETVGMAEATLSNIRFVRFPRPTSHLESLPGFGVRWTGTEMHPSITADYSADFDFGFWSVTKTGTMQAQGRNLHFIVDFFIGRNTRTGRPIAEVYSCTCNGDVALQFRGGWSDMLNVGSQVLQDQVEGLIGAQICANIKKEINTKLNAELEKLPVTQTVEELYQIDYHLVQYPEFVEGAMETYVKGAVYLATNPVEPPFQPPLLPVVDSHMDHMVYVYLTDYTLNSFAFAVFNSGVLRHSVNAAMLPDEAKVYLNTTCGTEICLGTIFPQLERLFPRSVAEVDVFATVTPHVIINQTTVRVDVAGEADFFVDGHADETRDFLFSINLTLSLTVDFDFVDDKVVFNVSEVLPAVQIKESSIGDIGSGFFFESVLRIALKKFLLPKLTELGTTGVPMPVIPDVAILNTQIVPTNITSLLIVGTDIDFTGTLPSLND
nr:bactericidal permeability-increasing protein [Arenicola marina]